MEVTIALEKAKPENLSINPFALIDKGWILIFVGTEQKYSMMTVSWGALGAFWGKNVANIHIHPQRYTLEPVNEQECYALNFFGDSYEKVLAHRGAHSGRDVGEAKESGLTPVFDAEASYFQGAKLVLICRKLHCQKLGPTRFIDPTLDGQWYPEKDYHHILQGEIVEIL